MCKQPHLCKRFALKCANNHICANTRRPQMCKSVKKKKKKKKKCKSVKKKKKKKKNTPTTNVQTWRLQMCKGSILTWNVQTFHKCANRCFHQESTTFVQTFHPQMCKQPHLCNYFTLKCANMTPSKLCKGSILTWNAQLTSTNVQIIVFIKNQFTPPPKKKSSIDGRLILSQNCKKKALA